MRKERKRDRDERGTQRREVEIETKNKRETGREKRSMYYLLLPGSSMPAAFLRAL